MKFSDTTNKNGLIQDCEVTLFSSYGYITSDTDLLKEFTNRLNRSLEKAGSIIMSADGRWQWDDTNNTDHPIATANLVQGQADYKFDVSHLKVHKLYVKQNGNNYLRELKPVDIHDPLSKVFIEDNNQTTSDPLYFDKIGGSIFLYPTPNYSSTNGLKIFFQREPNYFASTDTTKEAGIPYLFHRFISLDTSFDYAVAHQLSVKNDLKVLLDEMEQKMIAHYAERDNQEKIIKSVIRSSR